MNLLKPFSCNLLNFTHLEKIWQWLHFGPQKHSQIYNRSQSWPSLSHLISSLPFYISLLLFFYRILRLPLKYVSELSKLPDVFVQPEKQGLCTEGAMKFYPLINIESFIILSNFQGIFGGPGRSPVFYRPSLKSVTIRSRPDSPSAFAFFEPLDVHFLSSVCFRWCSRTEPEEAFYFPAFGCLGFEKVKAAGCNAFSLPCNMGLHMLWCHHSWGDTLQQFKPSPNWLTQSFCWSKGLLQIKKGYLGKQIIEAGKKVISQTLNRYK